MGRLSKADMEEIREVCSLSCEYSGTEEMVLDIVSETLMEMDSTDLRSADEIGLTDGKEFATLDDFVRIFWGKAVEKILNVVETQEESDEWEKPNTVTVEELIQILQEEDREAIVINGREKNIRVYSGRENKTNGKAVVMLC